VLGIEPVKLVLPVICSDLESKAFKFLIPDTDFLLQFAPTVAKDSTQTRTSALSSFRY
jgi:hypothetical protein